MLINGKTIDFDKIAIWISILCVYTFVVGNVFKFIEHLFIYLLMTIAHFLNLI